MSKMTDTTVLAPLLANQNKNIVYKTLFRRGGGCLNDNLGPADVFDASSVLCKQLL